MRSVLALALTALLTIVFGGTALADHGEWYANEGSSYEGGVVTLDSTDGPTSYENDHLGVPVENGDTITFDWYSEDVECAGGVPRVFIQGGAYNTFDSDPAGEGACGTDDDGDGWYTVTATIDGITAGDAGYTGIVNDNPEDPGTILVRNLTIAGERVLPGPESKQDCKDGGWRDYGYRNQGQCVSSVARAKS